MVKQCSLSLRCSTLYFFIVCAEIKLIGNTALRSKYLFTYLLCKLTLAVCEIQQLLVTVYVYLCIFCCDFFILCLLPVLFFYNDKGCLVILKKSMCVCVCTCVHVRTRLKAKKQKQITKTVDFWAHFIIIWHSFINRSPVFYCFNNTPVTDWL